MRFPVVRTAKAIYSFVAGHVMVLLRLTALPMLITSLGGTLTSLRVAPYIAALESRNPGEITAAIGPASGWLLLGVGVPLVMSAVAGVAILQYVVRGEQTEPDFPIHVGFGLPELRVIAVTLIIVAILILASMPFSLLLGLISAAFGSQAVVFLGSLCVVLALLVIGARWAMAYPVAVIEEKINFERAWSLMRQGYWSFLALMLAVLLPLFALDVIAGVLAGPSASGAEGLRRELESKWILLTAVSFVINFFVTAVFFSALGVVYRILGDSERAKLRPWAAGGR